MLDTVGVTLAYFYSEHTHTGTYVSLCLGIFCKFSWDLDDASPVLMPKPRLLPAAPSHSLLRARSTFHTPRAV